MDLSGCEAFEIRIEDSVLDDLHERIRRTRWPEDFANDGWIYGVEKGYLEELVSHWLEVYDWRSIETEMNRFEHYRVEIDEIPIHFMRAPGVGPDPMPLLMSHGWPWSFWDLQKIATILSDPGAHGSDPADAFDVIVPSLPGFGFSSPLRKTGVNFWTTADLFSRLMTDVLKVDRYGAQGGDFGAMVSAQLGHKYPEQLTGVQITMAIPLSVFGGQPWTPKADDAPPEPQVVPMDMASPDLYDDDDRHRLEWMVDTNSAASITAHAVVQGIEPQTLGYGLTDSPVGLLAWLLHRRRAWSGNEGNVEEVFTKDELITLALLYWVTETATTGFRYYWEAGHNLWHPERDALPVVSAPTGVSLFRQEPYQPPTAWIRDYYNLERLTEFPVGGHFGPAEHPELLAEEVRQFFRPLR